MTPPAYMPARDIASKVRRRLTQWRAAKPARLRFAEPMLSICFDDFPASAAVAGAQTLEQNGARGTFYAAAGLREVDGECGLNFSAADLTRLVAAGHEIGCHTFAHADCAQRKTFDTLRDIAANRDALGAMGYVGAPATLAYPYGETTHQLKSALPPRYKCARGILPGLNIGRVDLMQLRAYPLFGDGALNRAITTLKRAARRRAWMIVFTHDVGDTPSPWGTRTADLNALLLAARRAGVAVTTVSAALSRGLQ
jgi:peptidoglycan/xylan/chitin deacetylase (PgdA/CDA1 family)